MIPHIQWDVSYNVREYSPQQRKYVTAQHTGKCLLAFLENKKQAGEIKKLGAISNTKFKGRFGLRRGPLLVLFIKRPSDSEFRPSPIVVDNGFINKWSAGLRTKVTQLTMEEYFKIALRNKYRPNKTFTKFLEKWFNLNVTKNEDQAAEREEQPAPW